MSIPCRLIILGIILAIESILLLKIENINEPDTAQKIRYELKNIKTSNEKKPLSIQEMIIEKSEEAGVNPQTALRIANCESGFRISVKNNNSSATGIFQWIDKSWNYYGKIYWKEDFIHKDKKNPEDNIELAINVMRDHGLSSWNESKPCWIR